MKRISRKFIPWGCRTRYEYIPSLTSELSDRYENDPFNLDTIKEGERLLENITEVRRTNWHTLLNNVGMKHSSSKARGLIKKLDCVPSETQKKSPKSGGNQKS